MTGPGGFINITQNAKRVCFVGTFTAGHPELEISDGRLHILREGSIKKFCRDVEQITFSGRYAQERGIQEVMIVTERAVFQLTAKGLMLTEIAPGIDLEKDVLGQMEFEPVVSSELKVMEKSIFKEYNKRN